MNRLLQRAREERAQVLVIVCLLTTVFLGMTAMTVDIGVFVQQRQHVRDTVDAAALAGAQQLGVNQAQAATDATTYATNNDSNMTATVSMRCLVGDRDGNGLPDAADIGIVCNPGGNASWTCIGGRCVSLCVTSEGDVCNTIVVGGSKTVPFHFASALRIFSADTGIIQAAACRGACGSPPTMPIDDIIVIDRSSSMDSTELADAKTAANAVLKAYQTSLQHVALGVLGPNHASSTCGSPNSGGKGIPSADQTIGSWVPVPYSSDYLTASATPTLNTSSVLVKSIACLQNSSVGTNLSEPMKQARIYSQASGRAGVKQVIMFFTDGAANEPSGTISSNTGYLPCSANAAVTSSAGDNNGYQTTPGNACADGGGNAVDTDSGTGTSTSCTDNGKDKHLFYNYSVGIPAGETVAGIEVRLDSRVDSTSTTTRRLCVQLSWNGGTSWTTAQQTANLTTSEVTYTLGTSSDLWGHAWTATEMSNANFRVRVIDVSDNNSRDFTTDYVAVRVTYSHGQDPCNLAVQEAATAKAAGIEVFTLGYGLQSEICSTDTPSSPYYNQKVTKALAAMATSSVDETGCDTTAEADQENADLDHFYCETSSSNLSAIFQQAAAVAASSPRLISLPGG